MILAGYIGTAFADSFTQEADYLTDTYLILIVYLIWLESNQTASALVIVACINLAYFFDKT